MSFIVQTPGFLEIETTAGNTTPVLLTITIVIVGMSVLLFTVVAHKGWWHRRYGLGLVANTHIIYV